MLLVAVALYFLLACLISWLLLFPAGRGVMARLVTHVVAALRRSTERARQLRTVGLSAWRRTGPGGAGHGARIRHRYSLLCAAGVLLLGLPAALAWMASGKGMLGAYAVSTREVNTQVAQLLQGEQLSPPETLPPTVFATAEVAQERPLLVSASRDWDRMDAEFTQRLLMVFKIMKEQHGYEMALLEGYRSPERQQTLAAAGSSVTNAGAYQSWHQYGLAADCAFLRDGKLVISEKDAWAMRGYELYGQVAESVGLTWGGRWKMMDFGHTELRVPGVMKRNT